MKSFPALPFAALVFLTLSLFAFQHAPEIALRVAANLPQIDSSVYALQSQPSR